MSVLYLVLLLGVSLVILGTLIEAMASVTRKPNWHRQQRASVTLVPTVNSRTMDLPFVGSERRAPAALKTASQHRDERDAA